MEQTQIKEKQKNVCHARENETFVMHNFAMLEVCLTMQIRLQIPKEKSHNISPWIPTFTQRKRSKEKFYRKEREEGNHTHCHINFHIS